MRFIYGEKIIYFGNVRKGVNNGGNKNYWRRRLSGYK